jgi:Ser/Thr protein kinase RdoA (MazF antagonist)
MRAPAAAFALPGPPAEPAPFGRGHINATYRVEAGGQAFLLQRINPDVFPDPEGLMANLERVTEYLRGRLVAEGFADPHRRGLTLVPTREGRTWVRDEGGALWRCLVFIEGTCSLPKAESATQAETAAFAFGNFLRRLEDLPAPPLGETIPHVHDGRRRLEDLHRALASDAFNRAREARIEIEALLQDAEQAALLQDLREHGALPLRPTHQDTKLDNVLLDERTGEALCVVDLDTVMPGLALGDFADLARSACSAAAEDDTHPRVQVELFAALVRGFDRGLGAGFTALERELLVPATQAFARVLALRFLTDHLEGDRYFRIHRPGQNLERARAQLALLRALRAAEGELTRAAR